MLSHAVSDSVHLGTCAVLARIFFQQGLSCLQAQYVTMKPGTDHACLPLCHGSASALARMTAVQRGLSCP